MSAGLPPDARPETVENVPLADCRVLVVDDSRFSRAMLRRLLEWVGIRTVLEAGDGEQGLALLGETNADLVIADVDMPRMDGLEFCRRIREVPAWSGLPVLMQISAASDPAGMRSFEAGANDIISKPLNAGECMARIRLHLEKQFYVRRLSQFHRRLASDLRLARGMQMSLIPDAAAQQALAARYGLALSGHFESSEELGGDFWTLFDLSPHQLGVLIADFSGHGVSAAINTFRFHTLIERMPPQGHEPGVWLAQLNQPLKDLLPIGQFATCFYGVIDTAANTLSYAAAGAPSPLLLDSDGRVTPLDASGLMLGISSTPLLTVDRLPFGPGASLLLYSDALTEAIDQRSGGMIGEEGLMPLATHAFTGGAEPLPRLLAAFDGVARRPLSDDLTIICIHRP